MADKDWIRDHAVGFLRTAAKTLLRSAGELTSIAEDIESGASIHGGLQDAGTTFNNLFSGVRFDMFVKYAALSVEGDRAN